MDILETEVSQRLIQAAKRVTGKRSPQSPDEYGGLVPVRHVPAEGQELTVLARPEDVARQRLVQVEDDWYQQLWQAAMRQMRKKGEARRLTRARDFERRMKRTPTDDLEELARQVATGKRSHTMEAYRLRLGPELSNDERIRRIAPEDRQIFLDHLKKYAEPKQRGSLAKLGEALSRGFERTEAAPGKMLALAGPGNIREQEEWSNQVKAALHGFDPIEGSNLVTKGLFAAGEMAPPMAVGAGAALLGGVPAAVGYWVLQIAPDAYFDLRREGISEKLSRPVAIASAIPEALIEMLQVSHLTPNLKQGARAAIRGGVREVAKRFAKKAGTTYAKEMGEETAQEIIRVGAQAGANYLERHLKGTDLAQFDWGRHLKESLDELQQAALAMPFLMLPGAAVEARAEYEALAPKQPECKHSVNP